MPEGLLSVVIVVVLAVVVSANPSRATTDSFLQPFFHCVCLSLQIRMLNAHFVGFAGGVNRWEIQSVYGRKREKGSGSGRGRRELNRKKETHSEGCN